MTPDTTCPSEEHIFGYLIDQKEGEVDHKLKSHLERCNVCSKVYARLNNWESNMNGFIEAIDQGNEPESLPDKLGKYKVIEQIGIGGMGLVLKAYDAGLDRYVAIKVIKDSYAQVPDFKERFLNEAKNLAKINTENIVQIFDFASEGDVTYLVMEYVDGLAFNDWCREKSHHLPTFFYIFKQILNGLKTAHNHRILHRDLTPNNIMVNREGRVKILDFGLAKALGEHVYQGEFIFSGTMTYVAPEVLSGDAPSLSSDLYAIALASYEGLTGHHPFRCDSTDDTRKKILSAEIVPPTLYRPDLPKKFETIILKCLNRDSKKRYTHIDHVEEDLASFLSLEDSKPSLLREQDNVPSPLREHDLEMELKTPSQVYGREKVLQRLGESFSKVREGNFWSSVIFGPSGIGKSQLIHSFTNSLDSNICRVVSGKFEQLKDPKPYSAIISAFESMLYSLQHEGTEVLEEWKSNFEKRMSGNGRVISNVIPLLNEMVSEQPVLDELPPSEARQRFENAMIDFIRSFCSNKKSLILFIDDIQWADSGSLNLISRMLRGENLSNLMLIVSFRGEDLNHYPWLREQYALKLEHSTVFNINELMPLDVNMLEHYLKDAMSKIDEDLQPLAEVIHQKTGGNPLYFRQWLEQLRRMNLIYPDPHRQTWLWHLDKIRALDPHKNLLQLMREKLNLVSEDIRSTLSLAACIGPRFDTHFLAELMRCDVSDLHEKLVPALELGLIEIIDNPHDIDENREDGDYIETYRFFHDQVQNAAYECINSSERSHAHRRIAQLRLRKIKALNLDSWLFDIAHHYNLVSLNNLTEKDLFERVKLNYRAGRRARSMHAYEQAHHFLETAARDLSMNFWDKRYDMAFVLHMERMVCAFLNSEFSIANECLSTLEHKSKLLAHQVLIEEKKIGLYTLVDRNDDALDAGHKALARLGVRLPLSTISTHLSIGKELLKAKFAMRNKDALELFNFPVMKDWKSQRAMDIMPHLIHPAAVCRPDWIPVLSLKMFNLTCKKGLSNGSGFSVVAYAMLLAILGNYEKSYLYGTTALKLEDNIDSRQLKCMTTTMFSALVVHWKRPMNEQTEFADRGMQYGHQTGDLHYGGLCRCAHFFSLFFRGTPINELESYMGKISGFMDHVSGTPNYEMYALWLNFFLRLQGKSSLQCSFYPQQFDLESFEKRLKTKGNPQNQAQYELLQAIAYVFEGDDQKAYEHITRCAKHSDTFISLSIQAEYVFYHGLIAGRILQTQTSAATKKLLKILKSSLKRLKKMSENSPDNFSSRYHLLLAIQMRYQGDTFGALKMAQQALTNAREGMSCHMAALCAKEAEALANLADLHDLSKTMKTIASQSLDHWGYGKTV